MFTWRGLAGRWGGEEFLLLLPGTDTAGGMLLAERIRATLAGRSILTPDGAAAHVTASFGLATLVPGMSVASSSPRTMRPSTPPSEAARTASRAPGQTARA